jgi:predicted outer membrane repeat protein
VLQVCHLSQHAVTVDVAAAVEAAAALWCCSQMVFGFNIAQLGGAIAATGKGFAGFFAQGHTQFNSNSAGVQGGAVYLQRTETVEDLISTLSIADSLCAQYNVAPVGAFAALDGKAGLVLYGANKQRAVTSNEAGDIALTNDAFVRCDAPTDLNTNNNWPSAPANPVSGFRQYTATGDMCACNDAFLALTSTTCGECLTKWDGSTCSCKVSGYAPQSGLNCAQQWLHGASSGAPFSGAQ